MKIANILMLTASVALLGACEKGDTATPADATPEVEAPAADDVTDEAADEADAEADAEEEAPAEEAAAEEAAAE